ncbi:MAG: nicotinate phosphoribosyltransferase [Candidatus Aenigmarchaeota archaeon]|nr:nicotinate phosphoribosyltransferase [Candidatus Aenigmarchaeota archaeon]
MNRETEFELPADHRPHTDKYFMRTAEILKGEGINPFVRYQAFIRQGPGVTAGIDESIAAIMKYSPKLAEHGGRIYALHDGVDYQSTETLMFIDGPVQDLVETETMYLSILSDRTGKANGVPNPDLDKIRNTAKEITTILEKSKFGPRPCSYFGARHFGYEWDAKISRAAYEGGFVSASTDVGAGTYGQKGGGTVPHAAVVSMAIARGVENSAVATMRAFNRHIPKDVPRIFLADTFNKEIQDTLKVADALDNFWGPRFDTNGGSIAEGAEPTGENQWRGEYWSGKGVTISGVRRAREALNRVDRGKHRDLKIALTSGFSNPKKVAAFVEAEEKYNYKLFDFIGAGFADNRHLQHLI